jgi:hypothetical protein
MSTILAALQLAVALLTSVSGNTHATAQQKQAAIGFSYTAVSLAQQFLASQELPTVAQVPPVQIPVPPQFAPQISATSTGSPGLAIQPTASITISAGPERSQAKSYRLEVLEPVTLKTLVFEVTDRAGRGIYPIGPSLFDSSNAVVRNQFGDSIPLKECMAEVQWLLAQLRVEH